MKWFEIAPILSICINLISASGYATQSKWHMVGYWLCAGYLTFCVTFLQK